jgi:hypothetical protein
VEWTVDLPLSFGWQAHDIVVSKIEAAGEAALIAALKRESRGGSALALCALAVTDFARGVADLENADPGDVLVNGLGTAASASGCHSESAAVTVVDDAGRAITLADDLERLHAQTKVLEKAHVKMSWVQRAAKALTLGLKFLPR